MSVPGKQELSLRPGRLERKRLVWALVISLAFHAMCFGGYEFTYKVLPGVLNRLKILAALAQALEKKAHPPEPPKKPEEMPLVFVDVNPDTATPEPPKDAKYYSAVNSKAANPDIDKDTDTPKITGQAPDLSKVDEAARHLEKLQANVPPPQPQSQPEQAKPTEQSKPKPAVGDLAMAKPEIELKPNPDAGKEERKEQKEQTRPRTLADARMRHQTPGAQRKQDGGVHQRSVTSSLDAKATITGGYDSMLVEAISQRWYDLLDERANTLVGGSGVVVMTFKLHADGTITELKIADNTTPSPILGLLCYQAIHDISTPVFQPWPDEMKHVQIDPRPVSFTFRYL